MITAITVDDFGTQWFTASKPGFVTKYFPCSVFIEFMGGESEYHQVACLETWCSWGLLTRDEIIELGFIPRY
jgi:hypothetical protein